jgi:SAM-dependent methyltransferase
MIIKKLSSGAPVEDEEFDAMYSRRMQKISAFHFTPVKVAQAASRYLVWKSKARVLDIGSGAGKFCMIGAACTEGSFTGVEQRKNLHTLAKRLSKRYELLNIEHINCNVMSLDFEAFDAVYYFNAFYENIVQDSAIDQAVPLDKAFYTLYTQYMREQLAKMPIGTRLATYFSFMDEVPSCFRVRATDFDLKLKLWEKVG